MSLSFVSKAIQTTSADGTFEEKPVEGAENDDSGAVGPGVGLFEQLRQNQEQEDADREEQQRAMMRGTLALDEDDAAHLQELQQRQQKKLKEQMQQTNSELESFRAAQAERFEQQNSTTVETEPESSIGVAPAEMDNSNVVPATTNSASSFMPTLIKKKRRRLPDSQEDQDKKLCADAKESQTTPGTVSMKEDIIPKKDAGFTTLLAGYSSSSDDE